MGDYNEFIMDDYDFRTKFNSYWCGKSILYEFAYSYASPTVEYGAGNIKSTVGNTNDIYRVTLEPYDSANNGRVTAFKGSNCQGFSSIFKANQKDGATG